MVISPPGRPGVSAIERSTVPPATMLTLRVSVTKPFAELRTVREPDGALASTKCTALSVVVLADEPFTWTVAPEIGWAVSAFVTVPGRVPGVVAVGKAVG